MAPSWLTAASTSWAQTIFLHFFVWLGLALALPLLDFEGDPLAVQEMEVVDLPEEGSSGEVEEKVQQLILG